MTQQSGRTLLIKGGDGGAPEAFTTICGFKARKFSINNNIIDETVADCTLPGATVMEANVYGIQSMAFSGSGFFDNVAGNLAVANAARLQSDKNYLVIVPGWGSFTAKWRIENVELSGETEGSMAFEASWRASGPVTFVAE